jgi:hypothetical protein
MKKGVKEAIAVVLIVIGINIWAQVYVESLWFQELNLLPVFWKRLGWQLGIALLFGGLSWIFLSSQIRIAQRLATEAIPQSHPPLSDLRSRYLPEPIHPSRRSPRSGALYLPVLLPLVVVLQFTITALGMYYLWVTVGVWTPDYTLPSITPAIPQPFHLNWLFINFQEWRTQISAVIVGILLTVFSAWRWRWSLPTFVALLSGIWGLLLAGNWSQFLLFFNAQPFNQLDPQFQRDISFYIFRFPVWQLLEAWLRGLLLFSLLAVVLTFLQAGNYLSDGKFPGFSPSQLRHLSRMAAALAASLGFDHWVQRYGYLYAKHDVVYGANYTDIHWLLPVETGLMIFAGVIALWLAWLGWKGWRTVAPLPRNRPPQKLPMIALWLPLSIYLLLLLGQSAVGIGIELFSVQPNQLTRERPYIARNIAATRQAFNLEIIQPATLTGRGQLTLQDLAENRATLDNIRLWDPLPLLKTNRQLQQIRLYYRFPDADLDRYTIRVEAETQSPTPQTPESPQTPPTPAKPITTAKQQVLISPRELDYTSVPDKAKTWVNKHLVYTHGYGFTLSPVNLVDQGGLPFYFVKDIGTDTQEDALRTSSELIRASIPIGKPRIYFGELSDNYIMTNTQVRELDFPSGDENVYNTYDGQGGIALNSPLRKLLFAVYLRDWQMLFTQNFEVNTKVLFRRNINHRIRHIAPFLRFDRDPYLVTANVSSPSPSTLYWLIDAYTTSNYYPYSDPGESDGTQPARNFNYIRNSVKVAVDAYNGDVRLFTVDNSDPLIQAWQQIFPELFQPLNAMPAPLKSHIRYPVDLFSTQSERLLTYHMEDIDVFYNREDQWQIPREIYGAEQQAIAPYYLIMKLAGIEAKQEEFVLSQVYTPNSRNNLIALLFARCDQENYGKLLLYTLPKERLVYGPEQVEALINQDPVISERISLWNRKGSSVIQGNLLVIPIKEALLYVEPLYLEAEKNSLPTLARVVVVFGNQIAMAETLDGALNAIFKPDAPKDGAIVRSVDLPSSELN